MSFNRNLSDASVIPAARVELRCNFGELSRLPEVSIVLPDDSSTLLVENVGGSILPYELMLLELVPVIAFVLLCFGIWSGLSGRP